MYINGFGPVANVERSLNDLLLRFTAPDDVAANVAVISIDTRAQNEYGKWPWNRDRIADLLAAAGTAEPGAIAIDIELPDDATQDSAGYTDILAGQLSWINKAVLSYDIATAPYRSAKTGNPKYLFKNSISVSNLLGELSDGSCVNSRKVFLPAEKLVAAQDQLGFVYGTPDDDMIMRHHNMFMNYDGYYYPSLALRTAAVFLGVPPDQIKITEGKEISLGGKRTIPVNDKGQYFISLPKGQTIQTYSAADVLAKGFDLSRLKGKAVVITVDDPSTNEIFETNIGSKLSSAMIDAAILDNIINQHMINATSATSGILLLIMFAIGAGAALLLPRLAPLHRFLLIAGCLIVILNVNYILLSQFSTLPNTVYIGLELLLLMIVAPFLDSQFLTGVAPASHRTDLAGSKAKQKKPSAAQTHEEPVVRQIRSNATDPENQATAALGAEGSSSGKTKAIPDSGGFDHQAIDPEANLADHETSSGSTPFAMSPNDSTRPPRAVQVAESVDTGYNSGSDSGRIDAPIEIEPQRTPLSSTDLKSLGRYQITGALGKGAMGTVYKGIDPAINRPVALKTIRLDFVNDPAELAELKERLYREAQAAGKLSHPNIVTIYDVGSEASLQYIAMEYLEGQTLEELIKKKTKFNYKIIAQMIVQICNALTYAHDRGIVHRDIKPANIMVLPDYSVKVMDFGIARVDSNSMTKTGIAMGTPNYISPEQLRGISTDRRADLFSLGVVMYELLLGRRPFRGENITSLIYSIMNVEPDKPSQVNSHIPMLFDHIVSRSLKKDPNERYQKANEIVADLQAFVESFVVRV
jgi:serine/threonine-protein kinase